MYISQCDVRLKVSIFIWPAMFLKEVRYLTLIFIIVVLVFFMYQIGSDDSGKYFTLYSNRLTEKNGYKFILYWDKMWYYEDFLLGFGSEIFENCSVKNCFASNNKDLLPIYQFDALIFHGVEYQENKWKNPYMRHPNQVYIYYNLETRFNTPRHLRYSYAFFNWTLTYR